MFYTLFDKIQERVNGVEYDLNKRFLETAEKVERNTEILFKVDHE